MLRSQRAHVASCAYFVQMLTNLDADLDGKVNLSEWLLAMKANATKSVEATKKVRAGTAHSAYACAPRLGAER